MDADKKLWFVAGVVAGATTGIALAALLTPARGEENRRELGGWGKSLRAQGWSAAQAAATKSKQTAVRGRERISGDVDKLRAKLFCGCSADDIPANVEATPALGPAGESN